VRISRKAFFNALFQLHRFNSSLQMAVMAARNLFVGKGSSLGLMKLYVMSLFLPRKFLDSSVCTWKTRFHLFVEEALK